MRNLINLVVYQPKGKDKGFCKFLRQLFRTKSNK